MSNCELRMLEFARFEAKKRVRPRWPRLIVDLNRGRQRAGCLLLMIVLLGLSVGMVFAGSSAWQYSESSGFCGQTCHVVMKPQFERYRQSLHANVPCVECHIGPGASYLVKSKIDGIRQVMAVMANTYPRPVPSPVHNLRPARETCQECHTPQSFRDNVIKIIPHYKNDEASSPIKTVLILKLGGTETSTGRSHGIHWHISSDVEYIAADPQRQVMLWVGITEGGQTRQYFSRDMLGMSSTNFVEQARREGRVRRMDCIDCHNRAAHYIPTPPEVVDAAIAAGQIDRSLPFIRDKAVAVLTPAYPSETAADQAIQGQNDYYHSVYRDAYPQNSAKVDKALATIKLLYRQTAFPEMGLSWATTPNNGQHTPFPGCFRCHDGNHVSPDSGSAGQVISVKCNLCHTVPIVDTGAQQAVVNAPVIVGPVPESHNDYRWTIEHRSINKDTQQKECETCHGQNFCNNQACHQVSHPQEMLFKHPDEYRRVGGQVCYNCHQDVLCSRCHPGGIVKNP